MASVREEGLGDVAIPLTLTDHDREVGQTGRPDKREQGPHTSTRSHDVSSRLQLGAQPLVALGKKSRHVAMVDQRLGQESEWSKGRLEADAVLFTRVPNRELGGFRTRQVVRGSSVMPRPRRPISLSCSGWKRPFQSRS